MLRRAGLLIPGTPQVPDALRAAAEIRPRPGLGVPGAEAPDSAVELAEAGKQALNIATQGLGAAARGFRKLIDKPDPSVPIVVRAEPIPVSPEDTEEAEIDLPEQEGGDVVGAVIPTKLAERTKQE